MKTLSSGGVQPQMSWMRKWAGIIVLAGMMLNVSLAFAAPSPKPACGTNGAIGVTAPDPASYSYTRTEGGSTTALFTVSSPGIQVTGSCDSALRPYVFGNGNSGSDINVAVTVGAIDPVDLTLSPEEESALRNAISFVPASFLLDNPGTGTCPIALTFTNTDQVPAGTYDITIAIDPENGVGVGDSTTTFTVTVQEPTVVDTLPPAVTINAPTTGSALCLNGTIGLNFSATDPAEDGAGTGITAVRAFIASAQGAVSSNISGLKITPDLPLVAGEAVSAEADIVADEIGTFTITAEADDAAAHTGQAVTGFTVSLNVTSLPPMSVAGRQFKVGSTLPIKWTFTDCDGNVLPPFGSVRIDVRGQLGLLEKREVGEGADSIRWELDEYGNATHYITNYAIPNTGSYNVDVYVDDIDGQPTKQGQLSFYAAGKGGKN